MHEDSGQKANTWRSHHAASYSGRSPLGAERWLFLSGIAGFAVALGCRRLGDFDLPWHLATGRFISELRRIPRLDPLSFTHAPLRYVEPLTDIPFYWLAKLGGAPALQSAGGLLGAAIGLGLLWQLRRQGPLTYAGVALALAGTYAWLVVRPATVSFALLAALLGFIEWHRHLAREGGGRRILLLLPAAILLWANAHGFATIGAGLFACYAAYRVACRLARGRAGEFLPLRDSRDAFMTALAAVVGLAMTPLNAAGINLRLGPRRFSSDPISVFSFGAVTECVPPSIDFYLKLEPIGAILGILAVFALLFGRSTDGTRGWPSAFDVGCVGLGLLGLTWMARTVPIAILFLTPVVVRRLAAYVPPTPIARWGLASGSWMAAGFALLHVDTSLGFGFESRYFPDRTVAFIARERPAGPIWNFSPFGGYLSWRLYPDVLTFMDGRNEQAHDANVVVRSAAAMRDAQEFDALTREFGFEYAVTSAKDGESFGLPLARSARWTMVEYDDVAAVYVRNDGPNRELARRGYRALRHSTAMPEILTAAIAGGQLAPLLRHDGRLAAEQDPTSARAAFIAASGELAVRDLFAFDTALRRLAQLAPGHPSIVALVQARAEAVAVSLPAKQ